MTDRELLELAAKAASITTTGEYSRTNGLFFDYGGKAGCDFGWWNPLTDDGDALRLAVCLGIEVGAIVSDTQVFCEARVVAGEIKIVQRIDMTKHGATRRAIVRAAAEIGRAMP